MPLLSPSGPPASMLTTGEALPQAAASSRSGAATEPHKYVRLPSGLIYRRFYQRPPSSESRAYGPSTWKGGTSPSVERSKVRSGENSALPSDGAQEDGTPTGD